ncbi:chemotaxis protein CheB [Pedobacter sp. GR22-6]|uniref:chemotaxis protein CheB n=1 Tax=Pedobacter sp. GR22-6 TaxID=3127957 RepID=UPI00307EBBC1
MEKTFYTIAIGSSLGGLQALNEFFDHLSKKVDAAFVILSHLERGRRSILDKLLCERTDIPVIRVESDTQLQPGHVYVLIENTTLIVTEGWLRVQSRDSQVRNSSVDIFYESLARDFKGKAIGIILSGGGKDGLNGALAIAANGGKVLVQDPETAKAAGMPQAIVDLDHPRYILNPTKLAELINKWCSQGDFSHPAEQIQENKN